LYFALHVQCYGIVDEMFMGGELQDTVLTEITTQAAECEMDELTRALNEANLL
jgi:hypothetical protein